MHTHMLSSHAARQALSGLSWCSVAAERHKLCAVRSFTIIILAYTAFAGSGCVSEPGGAAIGAWITPESTPVYPDTDFPELTTVRCDTGRAARISAGVKEAVGFQVVLFTDELHPVTVDVSLTDLEGPSEKLIAASFEISRQLPIELAELPAWAICRSPRRAVHRLYYDPLLPIGRGRADRIEVPSTGNVALWIDINVPPGTSPGLYRSTLRIENAAGIAIAYPIELTVWPFALPDRSPLTVLTSVASRPLLAAHLTGGREAALPVNWIEGTPQESSARKIIDATLRLLHAHRCDPYLSDLRPVVKTGPEGEPRVDWADYDRLAARYIDGLAYDDKTAPTHWPLPIDGTFPDPERFNPGSDRYDAFIGAYISNAVGHFQSRGWLDRAFVGFDAETSSAALATLQRFTAACERTALGSEVVNPLPTSDVVEYGWHDAVPFPSSSFTRIWSPDTRYLRSDLVRRALSEGVEVWLRSGSPPYVGGTAIEGLPTDAGMLPWLAHRWGVRTIQLDALASLPARAASKEIPLARPPTDRWLIYPGAAYGQDAPLASVRLKRLRRGIQDYLYLHLLEQNHRPQVALLASECMVRYAGLETCGNHLSDGLSFGWVEAPELFGEARMLMAEQINRATEGFEPEATASLSSQLGWARLVEQCRRVRMWVEGVRVQRSAAVGGGLVGRCFVQITNDTPEPLDASLKVRMADPGAPGLYGSPIPVDVPAGRRMTARSAVQAPPTEATTSSGHRTLSVRLDLGSSGALMAEARMAYLEPVLMDTPPTIDGDLTEWPLGVGNVAGDFRLISSGALGDPGEVSGPTGDVPAAATTAFVMFDAENLYFAFRVEEPEMDALVMNNSSFVRYDGLTPMGEDLVEIIIDPTNVGTTTPADVYHVVVKANGALITERGVPSDPPVGEHSAWMAGATAAVRHAADHWTAEVRLPRAAFADAPIASDVWAINFARFHARTAEYANWAAAKSQIYNPRSMGNLVWPVGDVADRGDSAMTLRATSP